jgi:hypothetical protein
MRGLKRSDSTKAKMSLTKQGENHPRFNKGKAVYLNIVHAHGLEPSATYPNNVRGSESLGIPRSTFFSYIKST